MTLPRVAIPFVQNRNFTSIIFSPCLACTILGLGILSLLEWPALWLVSLGRSNPHPSFGGVNHRGILGDFDFECKCNGPNGLSINSRRFQRLMSYRLDDPGKAERNCNRGTQAC